MPGVPRAAWQDLDLSGRNVAFLAGVPLAMALVRAWNPAAGTGGWPEFWSAFVYWSLVLIPLWVLLDLCTRLLLPLQTRFALRLPLPLLLLLGALVAIIPMRVYLIFLFTLRAALDGRQPLADTDGWPALLPRWHEFVGSVEQSMVLFGLWIAVTLFHVRGLGIPRFGYGPASCATPGQGTVPLGIPPPAGPAPGVEERVPPAFLARLSRSLGSQLTAVQAEDHYIRVFTPRGSELVLYRFSDAIEELRWIPGAQVHRSWWVAAASVKALQRPGGRYQLLLETGQRVPVSRSHVPAARRLLREG